MQSWLMRHAETPMHIKGMALGLNPVRVQGSAGVKQEFWEQTLSPEQHGVQSKPLPGLSARSRWPPKWMPATALQTVLPSAALLAEGAFSADGGPLPAGEGPFPAAEQHEDQRGDELGPLQALLAFCSVSHLSSCISSFICSFSQ